MWSQQLQIAMRRRWGWSLARPASMWTATAARATATATGIVKWTHRLMRRQRKSGWNAFTTALTNVLSILFQNPFRFAPFYFQHTSLLPPASSSSVTTCAYPILSYRFISFFILFFFLLYYFRQLFFHDFRIHFRRSNWIRQGSQQDLLSSGKNAKAHERMICYVISGGKEFEKSEENGRQKYGVRNAKEEPWLGRHKGNAHEK